MMQVTIQTEPSHKSGTIAPNNGTVSAVVKNNKTDTGNIAARTGDSKNSNRDTLSHNTKPSNKDFISGGDKNGFDVGSKNGFPMYENTDALLDSQAQYVYTQNYSNGITKYYGTYDYSSKLSDFKSLGLSLTLLIFSIYLFQVSTRIYRQYFDKKAIENYFTPIFFLCALLFNIFWVMIVMAKKDIPITFLGYEFLNYPNQFVLGVMLSSLLLFTIGVFRFTLIAFIPNLEDDAKTLKDSRFSFIGIIFGIISALANIVTIWLAFK